ncbi:MAG: chromosome partitioning protein ParB [Gammaproteobacteria bacterium]|nr:chromosome partitioning protein ParB [Gammaproteobacteria bacterium]
MPQILYSNPKPDGSVDYWLVENLWTLAQGLPVVRRKIADLPGFDEVQWFGGPKEVQPTCRAVTEHARQIMMADLSHPLILSAEGEVWDGMHRVAKAYLEGIDGLDTVQFPENPPPDGTIAMSACVNAFDMLM